MARARDVVIVGGGHNGLAAAAYLARSGLDTLVCERRGVVGGAAVSEHPFGPGYTVTSLSYVVSLLSPGLVRDLGLASHGYRVYPQGPYFAPPRRPLAPAHPGPKRRPGYGAWLIKGTISPGFSRLEKWPQPSSKAVCTPGTARRLASRSGGRDQSWSP
jgi:hypothetical protein